MTNRQITYLEGEKLLADWRPHIGVFFCKVLFISFIEVMVLSPFSLKYGLLSWASFLSWLVFMGTAILAYIFWFEEHVEWHRRRDEVWILTDKRLIFLNPEDNTPVGINLIDIVRVKRFLWWALNVRLSNGTTTTMKYLPNSKHVRQTIRAARDNNAPPFPR